tara:strand:- start:141 stop:320 length:180 start_codon:yes stop_codon:yes gene_type:complete
MASWFYPLWKVWAELHLALAVAKVAVPDFLGSLFHVPVAMAYGAWNFLPRGALFLTLKS